MRVDSISTHRVSSLRNTNKTYKNETYFQKTNDTTQKNQVAFKSTMGKIAGGILGGAAAGLALLSVVATGGLAAAAALVAAEAGGAVVGGAVGDAVTGKDTDDNND